MDGHDSENTVGVKRGPELDHMRIPLEWAAKINPHEDKAHIETRLLLEGLGLLDEPRVRTRFDEIRSSTLAAYAYPHATRRGLRMCNDFLALLFLVDDDVDESGRTHKQPRLFERRAREILGALRGDTSAVDPLLKLARDLGGRLQSVTSRAWFDRFIDDVRRYLLDGTLVATAHQAEGTVPPLSAFVPQRQADSAVESCLDLIEVAEGAEIAAANVQRPEFHLARALTARVIAHANDLISYHRDVAHGSNNNLVRVLMEGEHLSFEVAARRAMDMVNTDLDRYLRVEATLQHKGHSDPVLTRIMAGQRAWMAANIRWSLERGRYTDPDSPFEDLRGAPASDSEFHLA